MLLTGPSFRRFALRVSEKELLELFFQTSLGRWEGLLERSTDFIELGSGLSYLDLMDDSGDELDSKSASVPNIDSRDVILVIQERGKLFEKSVPETSGIDVGTNDSGLIDSAIFNGERLAIEFVTRESAEYSCRILREGAFVDSSYIEETYAEFVAFVSGAHNEVTFKEIQGSAYYEDDHSLGGQLHLLLLNWPGADFGTGALEYFDADELTTLSLNDFLSDGLSVGLFKHALSMVNSGDGPYDEWSDDDKQAAQIGEIVRNNLLGNRSFYTNRKNVYPGTDVIDWFIQNNLSTSAKQAILRNKSLEMSHLNQLNLQSGERDTLITLHPSWIESKVSEVHNTISDEFVIKLYSDSGAVETLEIESNGKTLDGVRKWKTGQFVQQATKQTLLKYYGCLSDNSKLTNEAVQVNGEFEVANVSDGIWENGDIDRYLNDGQVVGREFSFAVSDLEYEAIPKSIRAEINVCRPQHEIEIYGDVIIDFFDDITLQGESCSGFISLCSPEGSSLLESLKKANERPLFLVDFVRQLQSAAENWYLAEFELAGESILEGMELEFHIGEYGSFNLNIGELSEELHGLKERLSMRNTVVFEDYPLSISLSHLDEQRMKMKEEFVLKYPFLENRFQLEGNVLSFELSKVKEISERNWTIDFLESNVDNRRSYNGLGKSLDVTLYSSLYELFRNEDGLVYFGHGNSECVVETVGQFDSRHSFILTQSGLVWSEDQG